MKEVSQDNPVTPQNSGCSRPTWLARSMSTASVSLLRLRNIERIYGSWRRSRSACHCEGESKSALPGERAVLWCALQPLEEVPQVLLSTPCRLLPVCWLVLVPDGGLFSWFEVFELREWSQWLTEPQFAFAEREESLEKWEIFGKKEMKSWKVKMPNL